MARRAVTLDPLSSRARFTLGSCYQWAGHLDEADASYLAARDITPSAGAAHYVLSRIRLLQGRAAEALEQAEQEVLPYSTRAPGQHRRGRWERVGITLVALNQKQ